MEGRFSRIDDVLEDIKAGKPIIIVDSPDRENEGDLFVAASKVGPDHIGFMRKYAGGNICVPVMSERLDKLGLRLMVPDSYSDVSICRFTYTLDYREIKGSGVSYEDKVDTIKALINPENTLDRFRMPGHVSPLRAESSGVLVRRGHTEGAVDLARLAGLYPAGVICEVLRHNGSPARLPALIQFADVHDFKLVSIDDLVDYRKRTS